jgi:ribulose-phosphate 3-epimerase
MAVVVPTITATNPAEYQRLLGNVANLTNRLHLDFSDGQFSPQRLINLAEAHWPPETLADVHLMYQKPDEHLSMLISMNPHLVIIHAEATCDFGHFFDGLKKVGIRVGLALLQSTTVDSAKSLLDDVDHLLVFTGKLGSYGGQLDTEQLAKVSLVKAVNPVLEVAVDGGINDDNAAEVVAAGADILNVGGYIQQAAKPKVAFDNLTKLSAEASV